MGRFIFWVPLAIFITLLSIMAYCESHSNKYMTGYIVAKEYTPEHMSNESEKVTSYASLLYVPIHVPHASSHPHKVAESYVWYVANKNKTRRFRVSKGLFFSKKCGSKVVMKLK